MMDVGILEVRGAKCQGCPLLIYMVFARRDGSLLTTGPERIST